MPKKMENELPALDTLDGKTIGERIAEIRKNKGLTQEKLSDKLGIKRTTLADYETGRSRIFDDMIARISITLEISPGLLLGIENKKDVDEHISLRYTKRIKEIENLPEYKRRIVLKALDDSIKANKS